jgi:hypothetical protein
MADYSRPKPIDPLTHLSGFFLRARCQCGRTFCEEIGSFAAARSLPSKMLACELLTRLRCSHCRAKPAQADVSRDPLTSSARLKR